MIGIETKVICKKTDRFGVGITERTKWLKGKPFLFQYINLTASSSLPKFFAKLPYPKNPFHYARLNYGGYFFFYRNKSCKGYKK